VVQKIFHKLISQRVMIACPFLINALTALIAKHGTRQIFGFTIRAEGLLRLFFNRVAAF